MKKKENTKELVRETSSTDREDNIHLNIERNQTNMINEKA